MRGLCLGDHAQAGLDHIDNRSALLRGGVVLLTRAEFRQLQLLHMKRVQVWPVRSLPITMDCMRAT